MSLRRNKKARRNKKKGTFQQGFSRKPYVVPPPCHTGSKYVFSIGKVNFYAGGMHRKMALPVDALSLSVGSKAGLPEIVTSNTISLPHSVTNSEKIQPYIGIDWPDMGVPALNKQQWQSLIKYMIELELTVVVSCQGGHGRTGTALSIIAGLSLIDVTRNSKFIRHETEEGEDIVSYLRSIYCEEIVESKEQIAYIEEITGLEITSKPTRMPIVGFQYGPQDWGVPLEAGKEDTPPSGVDPDTGYYYNTGYEGGISKQCTVCYRLCYNVDEFGECDNCTLVRV